MISKLHTSQTSCWIHFRFTAVHFQFPPHFRLLLASPGLSCQDPNPAWLPGQEKHSLQGFLSHYFAYRHHTNHIIVFRFLLGHTKFNWPKSGMSLLAQVKWPNGNLKVGIFCIKISPQGPVCQWGRLSQVTEIISIIMILLSLLDGLLKNISIIIVVWFLLKFSFLQQPSALVLLLVPFSIFSRLPIHDIVFASILTRWHYVA